MSYVLEVTVPRDYAATVEAFDPDAMEQLAGEALAEVAADARERLSAALHSLG